MLDYDLDGTFYHGSFKNELSEKTKSEKYNCLYITPSFAYAALYSSDGKGSHGCVFELKLKKGLKIFEARNGNDLDILKDYILETRSDEEFVKSIDWEGLKLKDWSTVCKRSDKLRDKLLIEPLRELGYDGYVNHEWDYIIAETWADGQGGCGNPDLMGSVSIGLFDLNSVQITDKIEYEDFFDDEVFNTCAHMDMSYLKELLADNYFGDNEEAEDFVSENLIFLELDDCLDLIEDYM